MAALTPMPLISVPAAVLLPFGQQWLTNGGSLSRTAPYSSSQLGGVFDSAVGEALAVLLGGIPVVPPKGNSLIPPLPDCVEVGPVRVIGGVRPQNFDVGYRPDGIRFAFDSKTLNDEKSVGKNWQNMVNDLATEATTVHTRFPHTVVAFMVIIPEPAFNDRGAIIGTLERLTGRFNVEDAAHLAEVISLVIWDPNSGQIITDVPSPQSPLRLEDFSRQMEAAYVRRYKGLPPHAN